MSLHFVLVHGAFHGGWCWYKIKSLMEISGYKVTCIDLKSAGIDPTDADTILSFDAFNKPLIDFLLNLPDNEQVILVGHSMGGLSLTDAIHKFGCQKIHMAIYIAAQMMKNGNVIDMDGNVKNIDNMAAALSIPIEAIEFVGVNSIMVKKEYQRQLYYNMSPIEDSTLASMLLRPSSVLAFLTAQFKEGPDADKVPRVYIKTLKNDHLMSEESHDRMIKSWPPSQVFGLESDHSPFFCNPLILCGLLLKSAASIK